MPRISVHRLRATLERAGIYPRFGRNRFALDWRQKTWSHPLEAFYAARGGEVVLSVPLELCRTQDIHGFTARADSASPFIRTIRDYLSHQQVDYAGSALENFYATYQPQSAAEHLRLIAPESRWLETMPALAAVLPWSTRRPEQERQSNEQAMKEHGRQMGYRLTIADGYADFGPVSQTKGRLEFTRLTQIADSIERHGFRGSTHGNYSITAHALIDGADYCFHVISGQHRMAALAAMAQEASVPIRIKHMIRRAEVARWPMVRQGWFTETEALTIFDRILGCSASGS